MRKIFFSELGVIVFIIGIIIFGVFKGNFGIDLKTVGIFVLLAVILVAFMIRNRKVRREIKEKYDKIEETKEMIKEDTEDNFKDKYYF
ncbi:MAG: hypothetical protein LBM87_04785 [Ruminococcus sp.]|jgi:membrane protein implicated in regulation of membrane protease activity|nr:hypothetical protein [Ruminococcus sp.]